MRTSSVLGGWKFSTMGPGAPSSLPIPSLWVVPVYQPQASSIVHQTWTGDSFHIGREGEGGMISENGIETFQYSCLENSVDRRAWWAALHGVAQSQT